MSEHQEEHKSEQTEAGAAEKPPVAIPTTTLTPLFKLVFITVLGLSVLSLLINLALVVAMPDPNDQAKSLIETCSTTWKTGFGAIVGLIGGKAM